MPIANELTARLTRSIAGIIGGVLAWSLYLFVRFLGRELAMRIAQTSTFGRVMARLVDLVLRKKNHCFERNLRLVFPGISNECIAQLQTETWCNNAKCLVETVFLSKNQFPQITITGLENLHAAGSSGIIFVTAHLHNMYYVPFCAGMLGYETAFLHRAGGNALLDALNNRLLGPLGIALPTTQTLRFVKHIRDGSNVAITPDLRVKTGRNASRLQFCGQPAWTSNFIAEMALAHRRAIVPTYILRHPDNRIEQVFEPAIDLSSGNKDVVQQLINDSISARVLAQPASWSLWNTNRWGP